MNEPNLVTMLAFVFGVLAGFMGVLGVFYSPVAFGVAVPFGVSAALLWYHGSGRLEARIRGRVDRGEYRRARDASEGPRGPRFGDSRRMRGGFEQARGRTRTGATDGGASARDGGYAPPGEPAGPTREEALDVLGLEPGASSAAVRDAYREHAKDLHPDRGGDEDDFKELNRAYDRLRE